MFKSILDQEPYRLDRTEGQSVVKMLRSIYDSVKPSQVEKTFDRYLMLNPHLLYQVVHALTYMLLNVQIKVYRHVIPQSLMLAVHDTFLLSAIVVHARDVCEHRVVGVTIKEYERLEASVLNMKNNSPIVFLPFLTTEKHAKAAKTAFELVNQPYTVNPTVFSVYQTRKGELALNDPNLLLNDHLTPVIQVHSMVHLDSEHEFLGGNQTSNGKGRYHGIYNRTAQA
jgi:hypothetical protein